MNATTVRTSLATLGLAALAVVAGAASASRAAAQSKGAAAPSAPPAPTPQLAVPNAGIAAATQRVLPLKPLDARARTEALAKLGVRSELTNGPATLTLTPAIPFATNGALAAGFGVWEGWSCQDGPSPCPALFGVVTVTVTGPAARYLVTLDVGVGAVGASAAARMLVVELRNTADPVDRNDGDVVSRSTLPFAPQAVSVIASAGHTVRVVATGVGAFPIVQRAVIDPLP